MRSFRIDIKKCRLSQFRAHPTEPSVEGSQTESRGRERTRDTIGRDPGNCAFAPAYRSMLDGGAQFHARRTESQIMFILLL
ncbi:hypothetical protein BLNAU_14425 [Blattamonas nauphoetae]|uniref:Uncharacterized protein n=1 Tax=Blattamonas nauphoetae TaxID=2049346 RepID=A0ABQ9XIF8_9EUKA|nr:hypothetical protein BLNAU_14425 [Blattamonas nauphoetae]